jgi:hypothetical protein
MTQDKGPGHFPGVRVKPLCHLSIAISIRINPPPEQAHSKILPNATLPSVIRCQTSRRCEGDESRPQKLARDWGFPARTPVFLCLPLRAVLANV